MDPTQSLASVVMYSHPGCGHCTDAKDQLRQAGAPVTVVDCGTDPGRCAAAGVSSFPTFKVGDAEVLRGNRPGKLVQALRDAIGTRPAPYGARPGKIRVMGSRGCGYTRQAEAELAKSGVAFDFVDCDKDAAACDGVQAFPTLQFTDGSKLEGWPGVETVKARLSDAGGAGAGSSGQVGNLPPVVVFGTKWCGYCGKAKKALQEFYGTASDQNGDWVFVDCDDKNSRDLCKAASVVSYPTIYVNGKRHQGFGGLAELALPPPGQRRQQPAPAPAPPAWQAEPGAGSGSGSGSAPGRGHLVPLPRAPAADQKGKVTVFGAAWCGFTRKLVDSLRQEGIDHTYVECTNPDRSLTEAARRLNLSGFPVTMIGDDRVDGYDMPRIRELVAAATGSRCDGIGCYPPNEREGFGVSPVMGLTMDKQPAWPFAADPVGQAVPGRFAGCPGPNAQQQDTAIVCGRRVAVGPPLGHWLFQPNGCADLRLS